MAKQKTELIGVMSFIGRQAKLRALNKIYLREELTNTIFRMQREAQSNAPVLTGKLKSGYNASVDTLRLIAKAGSFGPAFSILASFAICYLSEHLTSHRTYSHKMWLDLMISIGYANSMFNTYSISKYFSCFLHFTNIPLKS